MKKNKTKEEKLLNLGWAGMIIATLGCSIAVCHVALSLNNVLFSCLTALGGVVAAGLGLGFLGEKLACYGDALDQKKAYNELKELTDEEKKVVKEVSKKPSLVEAIKLTSNIDLLEEDYDLLKEVSTNNKIKEVVTNTENCVIRDVVDKEEFNLKDQYKENWNDSKEYTKQKLLRRFKK